MRFSHEAQSAYSILLFIITPVIAYISLSHLQYTLSTSWGAVFAWYIAACDNGAGKFKHNYLSHPTRSPFIHLGREQQCG